MNKTIKMVGSAASVAAFALPPPFGPLVGAGITAGISLPDLLGGSGPSTVDVVAKLIDEAIDELESFARQERLSDVIAKTNTFLAWYKDLLKRYVDTEITVSALSAVEQDIETLKSMIGYDNAQSFLDVIYTLIDDSLFEPDKPVHRNDDAVLSAIMSAMAAMIMGTRLRATLNASIALICKPERETGYCTVPGVADAFATFQRAAYDWNVAQNELVQLYGSGPLPDLSFPKPSEDYAVDAPLLAYPDTPGSNRPGAPYGHPGEDVLVGLWSRVIEPVLLWAPQKGDGLPGDPQAQRALREAEQVEALLHLRYVLQVGICIGYNQMWTVAKTWRDRYQGRRIVRLKPDPAFDKNACAVRADAIYGLIATRVLVAMAEVSFMCWYDHHEWGIDTASDERNGRQDEVHFRVCSRSDPDDSAFLTADDTWFAVTAVPDATLGMHKTLDWMNVALDWLLSDDGPTAYGADLLTIRQWRESGGGIVTAVDPPSNTAFLDPYGDPPDPGSPFATHSAVKYAFTYNRENTIPTISDWTSPIDLTAHRCSGVRISAIPPHPDPGGGIDVWRSFETEDGVTLNPRKITRKPISGQTGFIDQHDIPAGRHPAPPAAGS